MVLLAATCPSLVSLRVDQPTGVFLGDGTEAQATAALAALEDCLALTSLRLAVPGI